MNDKFVCGIGDYSKLGLLRVLNQGGGFRLGINRMKMKTTADPRSKLTPLIRLRRMNRWLAVIPNCIESSNPWSMATSGRSPNSKLHVLFP